MNNTRYLIENVSRHEYKQLIEIWERAVRATHYFLQEADILFYRELISTKYFDLVNLKVTRTKNGAVTAFMGTNAAKIEMLFVDPDYRGAGIGKALVNYAISQLGTDSVDVNEQNGQAVGFYYSLGFILVNRLALDGMGKPYPILQLRLPDKLSLPNSIV